MLAIALQPSTGVAARTIFRNETCLMDRVCDIDVGLDLTSLFGASNCDAVIIFLDMQLSNEQAHYGDRNASRAVGVHAHAHRPALEWSHGGQ